MINVLPVTCPYQSTYAWRWRTLPKLCFCCLVQSSAIRISKREAWSVRSSLNGSRLNSPENSSAGQSRLLRVLKDFQMKLSIKVQEIKTAFPVKLLFFLVGFYCATAFATVIGQTGDWDVLSAGLAVIVVEGIGAVMYKTSFPILRKIKSLISMFNYWKAGLTLGLFLDAFKYETDNILGLTSNPFNFDIDMFPKFFKQLSFEKPLPYFSWVCVKVDETRLL